jgi:hypothetical protein
MKCSRDEKLVFTHNRFLNGISRQVGIKKGLAKAISGVFINAHLLFSLKKKLRNFYEKLNNSAIISITIPVFHCKIM